MAVAVSVIVALTENKVQVKYYIILSKKRKKKKTSIFEFLFSNSLIIHKENSMEINV